MGLVAIGAAIAVLTGAGAGVGIGYSHSKGYRGYRTPAGG